MAYNDRNIAELDAAKRAYETYAAQVEIPDHLYNRCWDVFFKGWELSAQFNALNEVTRSELRSLVLQVGVSCGAALTIVSILAAVSYFTR